MLSDSAKYADNNMPTGYTPYANSPLDGNNNSKITVKNDTTAHTDAIVFVKRAGRIVRNTYIAAGDTVAIYVPNGTYTVLIYEGKGWHPTNKCPGNTAEASSQKSASSHTRRFRCHIAPKT